MLTIEIKLGFTSLNKQYGRLMYQIVYRKKVGQISSDIYLEANEFDALCTQTIDNNIKLFVFQQRINRDIALLKKIIENLKNNEKSCSLEDIKQQYNSIQHYDLFLEFMQEEIFVLQNSNRFGTAQNYKKAKKCFAEFLNGVDLPFSAITQQLIENYNIFLIQRGMIRNSVSFYMRIIRSVYNRAVKQKKTEQVYPFINVYTGVDCTRKRAVSEQIIQQLYKLNLPQNSPIALARDIFIFSFCMRGMSFVDIVYLKKENIQNDFIYYYRKKTKQLLTIKIEPCARQIIDRYKYFSEIYVFPLLTHTNTQQSYKEYQSSINNYNHLLRKISKILFLDNALTSYTARHTWATIARNHNVPLSVISASMGHRSEKTTQIYLESLENSTIDNANHEIIASVLE